MLYPLLSVFASLIIANYLRLLKDKNNISILSLFLGNYFLASFFSLALNKGEISGAGIFEISLGTITGLFFLLNFLVYQKNINVNSLSLSVTIMRISVIIPIIISLSFFSEMINILNFMGIAIILLSFIYNDNNKIAFNKNWLFLLFIMTGITDTSMKVFEVFSDKPESLFLFFVFSSAFIFNLLILCIKRAFNLKLFFCGMALGIPNQLSSFFFLLSLRHYPAAIVYPLVATLIVVFSIISDIIFWRHRFSKKQRIFFALMIIGIILINIG